MERRTVILAATGVVLLAALAGVLWAEGQEGPSPVVTFPVTWDTERTSPVTNEGELEEGESESYAFQVEQANVTTVATRLVWEDDGGGRDRFRLNLTTPQGRTFSNASANGTLALRANVTQVPTERAVNATGLAEAREQTVRRHGSTAGQGVWTVTVTLTSAPGQRPVPGSDVEIEEDGSNSYQLVFAYETFAAQVQAPPVE